MTRAVRLILVLLRYAALAVLGAAMALSVTWSLALLDLSYKPIRGSWIMSGADGHAYFCDGGKSRFGGERWDVTRASSELPYPPLPAWLSLPATKTLESESATTAFGWPLLCMTYHDERPSWSAQPPVLDSWLWQRGQPNSATFSQHRFPLRVLPWRFAANSAFYFLIAWSAFIGAPTLRRLWRRAEGLCKSCGYDRAGLPKTAPCPECGFAASPPNA